MEQKKPNILEEFPPRQKPSSFSIDQALEKAREREKQLEISHKAGGMKMREVMPRR